MLGRAATAEEVAPLLEAARECSSLISALIGNSSFAFDYIGYELGYFYGGAPWPRLCVWRSSSEFLAALFSSVPDHGLELEFIATVEGMEQWGHELYEAVDAPEGMPERHWWWRRAHS